MRPDSELQRRVVLGVDDSEHSERAFDSLANIRPCTATEMIPTMEMISATEMTPNHHRNDPHHRNDTGGHHRNDPRNIGNGIKRTTETAQQFRYVNNISDNVKDILLIIHAQEIPTHSAAPYASYDYWYYEEWQQSLEKVAKNSRALLEAYGEKCRERGINYKLYNERSNSPGEVICKLATDEKAHLLVVGARGVGKIHRKFFGSVSEYCVHHAHMPVVAVPPLKNNNIV